MKRYLIFALVAALFFPCFAFSESGTPRWMKKYSDIPATETPAPVVASSPFSSETVPGKWAFYWDTSDLPQAYRDAVSFSIVSYDLYLFDDGSAYMTSMTVLDGSAPEFYDSAALSGIWIMKDRDLTIRIGATTYKATITDNGQMIFYMTEALPIIFDHIDSSDAMRKQL